MELHNIIVCHYLKIQIVIDLTPFRISGNKVENKHACVQRAPTMQ